MKRIAALLLAMVCLLSLPAMAEEIPIFDSLLDARDYLNEQTRDLSRRRFPFACPIPTNTTGAELRQPVRAASADSSTRQTAGWTATW